MWGKQRRHKYRSSTVITEAEIGVMPPQAKGCRSWKSQGTEYLLEPLWGEQHCQFNEKLKQWLWQFWQYQSGFFPHMPSIEIWLMFFSSLKWGYAFLGGKPQRWSTQCIKCTYYQHDLSLLIWPWSSASGSISPLLRYSFSPSFAYCILWEVLWQVKIKLIIKREGRDGCESFWKEGIDTEWLVMLGKNISITTMM